MSSSTIRPVRVLRFGWRSGLTAVHRSAPDASGHKKCFLPGCLILNTAALGISIDDVENLSQIWAVAPALVKLALRDVQPSQKDKEPPWKRIAKGRRWAM